MRDIGQGDLVLMRGFKSFSPLEHGGDLIASFSAPKKGVYNVFMLVGSVTRGGIADLDANRILEDMGWKFVGNSDPAVVSGRSNE